MKNKNFFPTTTLHPHLMFFFVFLSEISQKFKTFKPPCCSHFHPHTQTHTELQTGKQYYRNMFSQFANKEYSFSVCKHTNIIDNQTKQTIFFYKQPRATTMMTTTTLGINKKNCKFFVFFLFSFILPKIMINFFFVSLCVCCCCCCAKDQKKQKIVGRKQQQYFMINDDDRNRIWTTKNIN